MNMNKIKLKRPKIFDIKETDSIEKIERLQVELVRYMIDLQRINNAIEVYKQEKIKTRVTLPGSPLGH